MINRYNRQLFLLGENSPQILADTTVMICGLGGVGGYILEGLARAGVGSFVLIDNDTFDTSNLNRQLLCTVETIGKNKTDIAKSRLLSINPNAHCVIEKVFLNRENIPAIISKYQPNYVADATDCIDSKVALAKCCEDNDILIISSMGTGNKLDPTCFECVDIFSTSVCPLAKVMRKRLKDEGVSRLKVVYSKETPKSNGKIVNSVSFVPSVAGMVIAGEILKDLCGKNKLK